MYRMKVVVRAVAVHAAQKRLPGLGMCLEKWVIKSSLVAGDMYRLYVDVTQSSR